MSLTRVTAPAVNPVTDAEIWDHLRVTLTGSPAVPVDQSHIDALILAAVGCLDGRDGWLGRALVTQTWDYKMDRFPSCRWGNPPYSGFTSAAGFRLPLPPLQSVTYINYIDTSGDEQTLSDSLYTVDASSEPARIIPAYGQVWPSTRDQIDAVTVRFVAGYDDGSSPQDSQGSVPGPIKSAIKLLVNELYQQRGESVIGASVERAPIAIQNLIAPYRIW